MGRCERVLCFMGREGKGRQIIRMEAIKWAVAKLHGDKLPAFFLWERKWSRSYRVTNQHPNLPWGFMTHGFLDPFAFPD